MNINPSDESNLSENFQVVRGEFFSHTLEPSFTLCNCKAYVNAACLKKLPNYDYIQLLVSPEEKILAIRPCPERKKDSFRWRQGSFGHTPKKITCPIFFAKIMTLMNWDPNLRYRFLGKFIQANDEHLFVFDLNSPEIYQPDIKTPLYPTDWAKQFGIPEKEHKRVMQISIFDKYAVFEPEKKGAKNACEPSVSKKSDSGF